MAWTNAIFLNILYVRAIQTQEGHFEVIFGVDGIDLFSLKKTAGRRLRKNVEPL